MLLSCETFTTNDLPKLHSDKFENFANTPPIPIILGLTNYDPVSLISELTWNIVQILMPCTTTNLTKRLVSSVDNPIPILTCEITYKLDTSALCRILTCEITYKLDTSTLCRILTVR